MRTLHGILALHGFQELPCASGTWILLAELFATTPMLDAAITQWNDSSHREMSMTAASQIASFL